MLTGRLCNHIARLLPHPVAHLKSRFSRHSRRLPKSHGSARVARQPPWPPLAGGVWQCSSRAGAGLSAARTVVLPRGRSPARDS
nr:unnamed protein product [Digitaria exilis]